MNHPLPYEVIERAAIMEHDGKLPRAEAERLALEAWRSEQKKPLERK
jgi:hypothetical protein